MNSKRDYLGQNRGRAKDSNKPFISAIFLFILLFSSASMAFPNLLNVQGKLSDINDNPRSGEFTFAFRLYTAETGGTQVWTESKELNTTATGVWQTLLGGTTALNVTFGQDLWLEVQVDSEVLSPRYRIAAVGYTFQSNRTLFIEANASALGNLTVRDSLDVVKYLNVSGGALYVNDANNRIGIGTASPTQILTVVGDTNITGLLYVTDANAAVSNGTIYLGSSSADGLEYIKFDTSLGSGGKFYFSAPFQVAASSPAITFFDPSQPTNTSRQSSIIFNYSNATYPVSFSTGLEVNGSLNVLGSSPAAITFGRGASAQQLSYDSSTQEFQFSGGKIQQDFSNIIKNGGFESFSGGSTWSGDQMSSVPDDWQLQLGTVYQFAPATYSFGSDVFQGYNSLKIDPTTGNTGKISQTIYAYRLQPNKTYSIGVWVKTTGNAVARLNVTGSALSASFREQSASSATWTLLKGQFLINYTFGTANDIAIELKTSGTGGASNFAFFDAVQMNSGGVLGEFQQTPITDVGDQTIYGGLRLRRTGFDRGGVLSVDKAVRTRQIEFSFGGDPGWGSLNTVYMNDPRYNWAGNYAQGNVFMELGGGYSIRMSSPSGTATELNFRLDSNEGPILSTVSGKTVAVSGATNAHILNITDGTTSVGVYVGNLAGGVSGASIGTVSNRQFRLFTNNIDRLTIDTTGRVGIGTSTPTQTLTVAGDINATGTVYGALFAGNAENSNACSADATCETNNINAGSGKFFVNATSGNVGIGTTGPAAILDVSKSDSTAYAANPIAVTGPTIIVHNTDNTNEAFAQIVLRTRASSVGQSRITSISKGADETDLAFGTETGSSPAERMRITAAGNVGIGTTAPTQKLTVVGDANVTGTLYVGSQSFTNVDASGNLVVGRNLTVSNNVLFVNNETGRVGIGTTGPSDKLHVASGSIIVGTLANGARIENVATLSETGSGSGFAANGTGASVGVWNGPITFLAGNDATNKLERMRINGSSGNVGIGTTGPANKLHVEGTSGALFSIRGTSAADSRAEFYRAGTRMGLLNWDSGEVSLQAGSSNALTLYADNAEKVRITTSGNVGIGTTSPGAKLDVAGRVWVNSIPTNLGTGMNATPLLVKSDSSGRGIRFFTTDFNDVNTGSMLLLGMGAGTGNTSSDIQAYTAGGSASGNLILNAGGGNVGIGTAGPAAVLDLKGAQSLLKWQRGAGDTLSQWELSSDSAKSYFREMTYGYVMTMTNAGNVGIGTTGPGKLLELNNADATIRLRQASGDNYVDLANTASGFVINNVDNTYIAMNVNGAEIMRLQNGGNLGIGTTSPGELLHIRGSLPKVRLQDTNSGKNWSIIAHDTGYFAVRDLDVPSDRFVIQNTTGNVGIGTTSPGAPLVVDAGTGTMISKFQSTPDGTLRGGGFYTDNGNSGRSILWLDANGANFVNGDYFYISHKNGTGGTDLIVQNAAPLSFYTSGAERVRIDSSGNVGIGTTGPGAKLEIKQGSDAATQGLWITRAAEATSMKMYISAGLGSLADPLIFSSTLSGNVAAIDRDGKAYFAGNVGIGTTSPSVTWTKGLEIAGDNAGLRLHATSDTGIGYVEFTDESNALKYMMGYRDSTGNFQITSGSDWSTNNLVTIQSGGNVGIGTTNPNRAGFGANVRVLTVETATAANAAQIEIVGNQLTGSGQIAGLALIHRTAAGTYRELGNIMVVRNGADDSGDLSLWTMNVGTSTEKARITKDGNLGIGTTRPDSKLHVLGQLRLNNSGSSGAGCFKYNDATNDLQFSNDCTTFQSFGATGGGWVDDGTAIRLATSTDSVGIGTTSPGTKLHLLGNSGAAANIKVETLNRNSDAGITLKTDLGSWILGAGVATGADDFVIYENDGGNPWVVVKNSGSVGINTTTPTALLSINPATNVIGLNITGAAAPVSNLLIVQNGSTPIFVVNSTGNVGIGTTGPNSLLQVKSSSAGAAIAIDGVANSYLRFFESASEKWQAGIDVGAGSAKDLQFYSFSAGIGTVMTLDYDTGNVGIGTTSPDTLLEIESNNPTLGFSEADTGKKWRFDLASSDLKIIETGVAEVVTFKPGGNVGIGTTAPTHPLTIGKSSATDDYSINISSTGGGDTGIVFGRPGSSGAALKHVSSTIDYLAFQVSGSGNVPSFSNAPKMVIDENGNIGIGTTGPESILNVFAGSAGTVSPVTNSKLVIEDDTNNFLQFLVPDGNNMGIYFGEADDNDRFSIFVDGGANTMAFTNNAEEALKIQSDGDIEIMGGNVGIGTTTPDRTLTIAPAVDSVPLGITSNHSARVSLRIRNLNVAEQNWFMGVKAGGGGELIFDDNTSTTRLAVTQAGNVGIGTTSPGAALVVQRADSSTALQLQRTGTVTSNWELRAGDVGNNDFAIRDNVAALTRLFINSLGNVGIGTTTPQVKLDVNVGTIANGGYAGLVITDSGGDFWHLTKKDASGNRRLSIYSGAGNAPLVLQEAGGNVGIGTTSPGQKLDVVGNINASGTITSADGANKNVILGSTSPGPTGLQAQNDAGALIAMGLNAASYGIYVGSNEKVTIDSSGNVGIGTTSPTVSQNTGLHLKNTNTGIRIQNSVNTGWGYIEYYDENAVGQWITGYEDSTNAYKIVTGTTLEGATGITVRTSGNVGIGTTAPSAKLHLLTDDTNNETVTILQTIDHTTSAISNGTSGIGSSILFRAEDSIGQTENVSQINAIMTTATNASEAGALAFLTRTGGGVLTERVRIDGAGNVGIGTTALSSLLHIKKAGTTAYAGGDQLRVDGGGSGNRAELHLTDGVTSDAFISFLPSATAASRRITIGSGATEAAGSIVIQGDGNVGIGTTGPNNKLSVVGSSNTLIEVGSSGANTLDRGIRFTNQSGAIAGNIIMVPNTVGTDSLLQFYVGGDGAGDIKMVVNDAGNVGIGTTGPGSILHVYGTTSGTDAQLRVEHSATAGVDKAGVQILSPDSDAYLYIRGDGNTDANAFTIGQPDGTTRLDFTAAGGLLDETAKMTILQDGNVGIGTTGPGTLLEVSAVSTSAQLRIRRTGTSTGFGDLSADANGLNIQADGSSQDYLMLNPSGGNVGIGTTAPRQKLEIYDGALILSKPTADNARNWRFLPSGATAGDLAIQQSTASGGDTYATKVTFDVNGNVGIGTTAPNQLLELKSANPALVLQESDQGADGKIYDILASGGDLSFRLVNDAYSSATDWMVVDRSGTTVTDVSFPNGNVGIGTASPGYKLHVAGDAMVEGNLFVLKNITNINAASVNVNGTFVPAFNNLFDIGSASSQWRHGFFAGNLTVDTNTLFVDSVNDRVGIGTTGPGAKLHVVGDILVSDGSKLRVDGSASGDTYLWNAGTNTLDIVAGGDTYRFNPTSLTLAAGNSLISDTVTTPSLTTSSGAMTITPAAGSNLNVALSTTGDFAVNTNQLYVDTSAGNVGIGTTGPNTKLDVRGDVTFGANARGKIIESGGDPFIQLNTGAVGFGVKSVAGTINLWVADGGNVGIGTTSPSFGVGSGLEINRSGNATLRLLSSGAGVEFRNDAGKATLDTRGAFPIILSTDQTERVRIDSSGNVGIGTTNPGDQTGMGSQTPKFAVSGGYSNINLLRISGADTTNTIYSEQTGGIGITTSGTNKVTIDPGGDLVLQPTGNVGIGTTGPGQKLEIEVDDATNSSITQLLRLDHSTSGTPAAGMGSGILFGGERSDGSSAHMGYIAGIWEDPTVGAEDGAIVFAPVLNSAGSGTERMRITSAGNVGIGTTGPGSKLDVNGRLHLSAAGNINHLAFGGTGTNYGFLQHDAADVWSLGTGTTLGTLGTPVLTWTKAGNVGIGTTAPTQKLTVVGDANITGTLYGPTNQVLSTLNVTGQTVLATSSGNVGIGTTGPGVKLDVDGSIRSQITGDAASDLLATKIGGLNRAVLQKSAGTTPLLTIGEAASWSGIAFQPGTAEKMRIQSDGNVGIGTTGPQGKIHADINARATAFDASNGATWHDLIIRNPSGTLNAATGIAFEVSGSAYHANAGTGIAAVKAVDGTDYGADLAFITRPQSAVAAERMRITSTGNVGIGTTGPNTKLDVRGRVYSMTSDTEYNFIGWNNTATSPATYFYIGPRANGWYLMGANANSAPVPKLGITMGGGDGTADVKLTIDSTGNVGIGTTGPNAPLEIRATNAKSATGFWHSVITDTTAFATGVGGGLQFWGRTTDSPTYESYGGIQGYKSNAVSNDRKGQLRFSTQLDGSGLVTRMTIDENGNVGIGTTGPLEKLHINQGNLRISSANSASSTNGIVYSYRTVPDVISAQILFNSTASYTANEPGEIQFWTRKSDAEGAGAVAQNMVIKSSGNVGIGTTTPTAALDVRGAAVAFGAGLNSRSFFDIGGAGDHAFTSQSTGTTPTDYVLIRPASVAPASGTGNMFLVDITGTSLNPVGAATLGASLYVGPPSEGGAGSFANMATVYIAGAPTAGTSGNGALIVESGNVGIGTTSPGGKLEVAGTSGSTNVYITSPSTNSAALYLVNGSSADTSYGGIAYDQSGDLLALYSGGSIRLAVNGSTGNVGIGTTGPAGKLDVNGATYLRSDVYINTGQGIGTGNSAGELKFGGAGATYEGGAISTYGGTHATKPGIIVFRTGTASGEAGEKVRIDATGNVGIGTTGPAQKLQVDIANVGGTFGTVANLALANTNQAINDYNGIAFTIGGGTGGSFNQAFIGSILTSTANNGASDLVFGTKASSVGTAVTEYMRIKSGGNVGIGTTGPARPLDVLSNAANPIIRASRSATEYIEIGVSSQASDSKGAIFYNGVKQMEIFNRGIALGTYSDLTGANVIPAGGMIIPGNVGIGTASPGAKLEVFTSAGADITGGGLIISRSNSGTGNFRGGAIYSRYITAGVSADALVFGVTGADGKNPYSDFDQARMVITHTGRVGIGTTGPASRLHVAVPNWTGENEDSQQVIIGSGTLGYGVRIGYDNIANFGVINALKPGIAWGNLILQNGGGNVGIGTTSPNEGKVEVKGGSVCVDTNSDGTASSCIASESDIRLKENIKTIDSALEKILKLRGVSFDWNVNDSEVLKHYPLISRFNSSPHSVGLIAQEVAPVLPEAIMQETVGDNETQYLQLDYDRFVPLLIEGVKELDMKIEKLEAENNELKSRLAALEAKIK